MQLHQQIVRHESLNVEQSVNTKILHDLMEGKDLKPTDAPSSGKSAETGTMDQEVSDSNSEEMSAWEKRLEGLE